MTDLVLFDFFGTLVRYEADRTSLRYPKSLDLVRRWGWAGNHDEFVAAWDEASRAVDAQTADSYVEPEMIEYADAFGHHARLDLTDAQRLELATTFVDEWAIHIRPIDGARELLEDLAKSARLGIVSNTNDTEMVPRLVRDHFSPALFEHTVLSVDHGLRKPHPSIYGAALDRFDVDASRTVFVGDSYEADFEGPIAAGIDAFLIDPTSSHSIPESRRLTTILDLPRRL